MDKIEMECNQCKGKVKWYESNPDEVAMKKVDNSKYYCHACLRKLGHISIDLN